MALFKGGNNPGNNAHVDGNGRIEAHAVSISEQSDSSLGGDAYNVNTGTFILTTDASTPIFYIKNVSESRELVIPRVFIAFGASTAGSGIVEGAIISNPSGGTIITATANPPQNFNFGSSQTLGVDSTVGATGLTVTGGTTPIEFLFPSSPARNLIAFDSIILPRGSSMVLTITPPSGNTSMQIQAGINVYLNETI